jgi:hypothetical protein
MENYGIILGQRPQDYMAGSFTFVSYEDRNPSGNWEGFLPIGEKQRNLLETMACVSFSACNCIETQVKHQTGVEENYSDRWIAKMSDTTKEGNYLYKVGDTIRKYGMVKESSYPSSKNMSWDEYYAEIPPSKMAELVAEGKEWLKRWDIKTEFIDASKPEMLKHIKHAPLQIVKPGHAIENFFCTQDIVNYFDSYEPYKKTINYGQVQAAYKYVLTPMEQPKKVIINDHGKIYIVVLQGFAVGGAAAKSMQALTELKSALEVPADAPTFQMP